VNQPVIKAAQLVKDIGSKLNGLENLGLDFYRKLAGTTIFITNFGSEINSSASKFTNDSSKSGLKLSTKLAKQFSSVLHSFFGCFCKKIGNGIVDTGTSIGDAFKGEWQ
jgi:hypothetical protein